MPNWYPGLNAQGYKVDAGPTIINGALITQPRTVTAPGTAGPGTAVANSTGADCMVYLSAAGGIGGVSTSQGTITTGTTTINTLLSVYVPANATITVNYAGALTWHWTAI